jgi:hypothetical protein
MSITSKLYCAAVIATGVIFLAAGLFGFATSDPLRLTAWVATTVLLASVKLRVPGMSVTVAGSCVTVLAAILRFGLGELMLISSAAGLAQSFINAKKRPRLLQVAFSVAAVDVAAGLIAQLLYAARSAIRGEVFLVSIVITAIAFFLVNTSLIAGIISLSENRNLLKIWTDLYSWSLPHHIAGGILGGFLATFCAVPGGYITLAMATASYILYTRMHRRVVVVVS